jgi:hypothetical protein
MKKINIYVGKNNSGKTFKLEKIKNECEDKCLYVPAEIICDAFYIKENQGNARKVD